MRTNSLALRLFLSATVWTVLILLVTGFALSGLYRNSVERGFDRRLGVYLKTLVADVASPDIPIEKTGQMLGEPLFELPLSGWYWQVTRPRPQQAGDVRRRARCGTASCRACRTWASRPTPTAPGSAMCRGRRTSACAWSSARSISATTGAFWSRSRATPPSLTTKSSRSTARSRRPLRPGAGAAAHHAVPGAVRPRAAQPHLARLAAIRSGKAEKLEGPFPVEIAPLARETNALLESNREIVERARTHVGNLAHALKTPLSVMMNEADARPDDPLAGKVQEQTGIMREQVTRHLERARIAARVAVVGTITDVVPVVQALVRTMEKTQRGKDLAIELDLPGEAQFRGERQDLEEMVGNLVDNAGKWASARVGIEVCWSSRSRAATSVRIVVDDDGPGLTPAQREQVARRGRGSTRPSPARGWGFRSWWNSPRFMAARSTWAPRRSGACGRNWCCRRGKRHGASGLSHLSSRKRAKSPSVEHSVRPCSIASAARWASETRLPCTLC